jgi:CBS domain-containing protein
VHGKPLSIDEDETLELTKQAMPVRLIATFQDLTTTRLEADVGEALALANEKRFDYLPVRHSEDGPIIGIFSRNAVQKCHLRVDDMYEAMGPDDLISAEASLLYFVWSADRQPRRLVLKGTEICGIVTLSDIQKLPVRMALFNLFIHFELLVTEQLRKVAGNTDPFDYLSPTRIQRVREKWQSLKSENMDHDVFSAGGGFEFEERLRGSSAWIDSRIWSLNGTYGGSPFCP